MDVCRGVAAAVLGDDTKVKYTPLTAKERFTALQSGEVDLLSRNTTWTSSRDAGMGMSFTGVTYYDGIGFLTHNKAGLKSAKELDGATVCIQAGTDTELNVADYFKANNMKYTPVTFDRSDESAKALNPDVAIPSPLTSPNCMPCASNSATRLNGLCCQRSSRKSRWGRLFVAATTNGSLLYVGRCLPC